MKTFPAVVVANYFVDKGKEEGRPVEGVLKLIKLVYIAHGWHLGVNKEPLFVKTLRHGSTAPLSEAFTTLSKNTAKESLANGQPLESNRK